jgi:hypothetical protein
MPTKTQSIVIVLALPRIVPQLILRATTVANVIEENVGTFPAPTPAIALFRTHIDDLVQTQTAFDNRLGTRARRDDAQRVVVADMKQLHAYVQLLANATPDDAAVIAARAAMTVRAHAAYSKATLALKQLFSGVVRAIAKAVRGARAYEWQWSVDDGQSWTSVTTTQASTTLSGLRPGVTLHVRFRVLTKSGFGDWSDAVSLIVN